MASQKRVRIIKKIRHAPGVWRFVSLHRIGNRYVWDKRPGYYFIEWWEGKKRRREHAGGTPSDATEAQRRKRNELLGELFANGHPTPPAAPEGSATPIADAIKLFLDHVRVHSPDKPNTLRRYDKVLEHAERVFAKRKFVEAISRSDMDDYKGTRSKETCARFKPLKDAQAKSKGRPPTYTQSELDQLFATCDDHERVIFATLLLTGLREEQLCFLTWQDLEIKDPASALIRVTGEGKTGFSPKDYKEREIPIPEELASLLAGLPREAEWVFPTKKGQRMTHLLRRLKEIAAAGKIQRATLHKFRHTYATRLLESGCDIVTVQKLMGHSDIETTRQHLNPDETLKREAVKRLALPGTKTTVQTNTADVPTHSKR